MAYLTISGFEVPVAAGSSSFDNSELGSRSQAFSGQQLPEARSLTRGLTLKTALESKADALPLMGLIQGDGHAWAFDSSLYSSKGLGPQAGYTVTMSATGGVTGGGYVQVTSAQTLGYRYLTYGDFSVMVYKYTGGAWHQYVYTMDRSSGTVTQYKDGATHSPVAGDSILNWFTYTSSTSDFAFAGKDIDGTNGNSRYDQLVIVPWLMTASMVAAFHTQIATTNIPFSPLPLLWVSGDIIPDGPLYFVGGPVSGAMRIAMIGSDKFGVDFGFTLTEFQGQSL
jgi:hypothetical protein